MGALFTYTFSAGIILLASYIIYKWLLSSENQPRFNRCVLLCLYLASFAALPASGLFALSWHEAAQVGGAMAATSPTQLVPVQGQGTPLWPLVLTGTYLAGALAVLVWAVACALRLARIVASGRHYKKDGYTIVTVRRRDLSPFSWGRYIVISDSEDSEAAEIILCHERAHIATGHFFDLLLAQAVCVVLWYNPASWLMLSELKSVHEYEADERVLQSGVNARQYQMLLIKKAVGVRFPSLANSLNHSSLKKRITMMYNQKSSATRRMRAFAFVPAAALALAVLNIPAVASGLGTVSNAKVTDFTSDVQAATPLAVSLDMASEAPVSATPTAPAAAAEPDRYASFPGGEMEMMKFLMNNMKYPEDAAKADKQGRVIVKFNVEPDGSLTDLEVEKAVFPSLDEEALRVVRLMPKFEPAVENGKPVRTTYVLPVMFKLAPDKKDK